MFTVEPESIFYQSEKVVEAGMGPACSYGGGGGGGGVRGGRGCSASFNDYRSST